MYHSAIRNTSGQVVSFLDLIILWDISGEGGGDTDGAVGRGVAY